MHIFHSIVGWVALASVMVPVTAYQCDRQEDHKNAEVTAGGKIYKLYCNSDTDPKTPNLEMYKSGIATLEDCATLCAKRAEGDCGHVVYSAQRQSCVLRPKPTAIKEGALISNVARYGSIFTLVYDRDVPAAPPAGETTPGTDTPGDSTGGTNPPADSSGNLPSYDCTNKKDHGKIYVAEDGKPWELLCDHANTHTGYHTRDIASLKDCVAACSSDPQCGGAEFHISTNKCEFEPNSDFLPYAGYHLWVPKLCPNTPRAANAIANPQQTTDLSCPGNDGKIYQGKDGTWYYIQCCSDSAGSIIKEILKTKSHEECVNRCTSSKECNSVSFDTKAINHNCKLYGHGGYSTAHVPGVHHLYATNPPTIAPDHFESERCSTECPAADGQIFASPTGENFIISCRKRHGTTYLKQVPDRYPSFATCMKACGKTPACVSVDYEPKTQNCYFSTNSKHPTIQAPAFMSAHSAGCSGACKGCEGTSCSDLKAKPLKVENYSCPDDQGRAITVDGLDYQIACQHAINSASNQVTAQSHTECVKLCSASNTCDGASWSQDNKRCHHHTGQQADGSPGSISQRGDTDSFIKVEGSLRTALAGGASSA